MSKKIITISRQFGSGGRTVGKMLADRLGYDFYDKELIEQVHNETGFARDFIEKQGEYSPSGSFLSYAIMGRDVNGVSVNDHVWNAQRKVILALAEGDRPCVIVGRCADYILRDRDDVLNVFIHADKDFIVKRIIEECGQTKEAPEKIIKDRDKKRSINYKYYTGREWGAFGNYDIALDTGRLGMERCVDILEKIVRAEMVSKYEKM